MSSIETAPWVFHGKRYLAGFVAAPDDTSRCLGGVYARAARSKAMEIPNVNVAPPVQATASGLPRLSARVVKRLSPVALQRPLVFGYDVLCRAVRGSAASECRGSKVFRDRIGSSSRASTATSHRTFT